MAFSGGSVGGILGQAQNPFTQPGRSPSPNPAANPFSSATQQGGQSAVNPFGQPPAFGAPSAQASNVFGQPSAASTTHLSPFGTQNSNGQSSPFGAAPTTNNGIGFGGASTGFGSNGFGSTGFGSSNGGSNGFGSTTQNGFGSSGNQTQPALGGFGAPGRSSSDFQSSTNTTNGASSNPFGTKTGANPGFGGGTGFGSTLKPFGAFAGNNNATGKPRSASGSRGSTPGGFGNGFGNDTRGRQNGFKKTKPNFTETLESKGSYVVPGNNGDYQVTRNKPPGAISGAWAQQNDAHHNPFKTLSERQADPAAAIASKGRSARFTAAAPVATLDEFSTAVNSQLKKDRVKEMTLPHDFFEPAKRHKAQSFRESHLEAHKNKVRESLEKGDLLDVYEKQINLEDAIDFRGTCEEMCPLYEIVIRVAEGISQLEEKEEGPDGTLRPCLEKFVKRHARSSAGDKPPLPSEVRTLGALKRTTDYLLNNILQGEHNLKDRHAFLWDRLRAVRRDFIFYTRMRPEETLVMVNILETIARFHAISHHLLAKKDAANAEYSAKQEQEAFQKTLISLKQAYMDLNKQGIKCDNEPEFMAYWILFFADDPSTIRRLDNEMLQKNWSNSSQVQTAVSLVHARLNFRTPLQKGQKTPRQKPYEYFPSLAIGEGTAYFDIVADPSVSYTMACVAEMSFTMIRDRLLNSMIQTCARSRDSPKDITPAALQEMLRFDTEEEVVEFVEGRGLNFSDDGSYLVLTDKSQRVMETAVPTFSQNIVERKRCDRPLLEVIRNNVYEVETPPDAVEARHPDSPEGMFVEDFPSSRTQSPIKAAVPQVSANPFGNQQQKAPAPSLGSFSKPATTTPFFGAPTPSTQPPPLGLSQGNSIKAPDSIPAANAPKSNPFAFFNDKKEDLNKSSPQQSLFGPNPATQPNVPAVASSPAPPAFPVPFAKPQAQPLPALPQPGLPSFGGLGSTTSNAAPQAPLFSKPAEKAPTPLPSTSTPSFPSVASSAAPITAGIPSFGLGQQANQQQLSGSAPVAGIQERIASLTEKNGLKNAGVPATSLAPPSSQLSIQPTPPAPSPPVPKVKPIEALTKWYVLGDKGMLEEFRESYIAHLVGEVFQKHQEEERERLRREEDEKSWEEAGKWRTYNLGLKFFYKWRDIARDRALSRRAREGKEAMKAYRESQLAKAREERDAVERKKQKEDSMRASQRANVTSSFLDDFQARQSQRKSSLASMEGYRGHESRRNSSLNSVEAELLATGVFNGVRNDRLTSSGATRDDASDADSVAEALLGPGPANTSAIEPHSDSKRSNMLRNWRESLSRSASRVKEGAMAVFSSSARESIRRGSNDMDDDQRSQLSVPLSRTSSLSRSLRAKARVTNFSGVTKKRAASPAGSLDQRLKVPRSSGLKTSHFRLRAMGMVHMPNGQYLHESIAKPMLEGKRFHGIGDYGLPAVEGGDKLDLPEQDGDLPAEQHQRRYFPHHQSRLSTSSLNRFVTSPPSTYKRKISDLDGVGSRDADARSVQSLDIGGSSGGKKQRTSGEVVTRSGGFDLAETERIIREMRQTAAQMEEGEAWYREQSAAFGRGESPWAN
ncbi:hypothetical protein MCOR02_011549 [Pyricularia oryzae]|nr:hypothetical protein MCOR01_000231 [Pyricularia oryzae]KAH9428055.1 hypothetical protein MCOR02_011549 [Pyricularia oryzae]KAI6322257.1 hypothetical protein MCOR34_002224 [Pyricularia oryzae]KAI6475120.1 hypothetical protein MCOR17_001752 [Pyricularia oryzae]KAI6489885.1 hypothetical protein MCOR13_008627 [Pyricularia oryzae]